MKPDKTTRLTVSEVRQKIFQVSGVSSEGAGSLAGQLFHRTAERALEEGHPASWKAFLTGDLQPDAWAAKLYDVALGPELVRLQPALRDSGAEVLTVWRAVQSFTRWFCGILAEAMQANLVRYDEHTEQWLGTQALFRTECELTATFHQLDWTGEVTVSGRADHLIQIAKDTWCVVEFKLGNGHREADAAQACLYHELLGGKGSAALVLFGDDAEPQQTLLSSNSIREVRPQLFALIGAMAGVTSRANADNHAERKPSGGLGWPKPAGEIELELGKQLVHSLQEFRADAQLVGSPMVGPTFIRYLVEPSRGISSTRIDKMGSNLQVRLHLESEPTIGRAAGHIAIDIPRPQRDFVFFNQVRAHLGVGDVNSRVLAGVDLAGTIHSVDLAKDAAHLLVAGVPGSGKSEWLRSAVASLLVTNTPETLRLVLVDPKRNAFPDLAGSPYLWRPNSLIDSPDGHVIPLLQELIEEMKMRLILLKQAQADHLAQLRTKTGSAPPRLVFVIDEFADLVTSGPKANRQEIENCFVRIAQVGRAPGIHLMLATQRPSRQVVSTVLKASVDGRLALRVASGVDSRIILDRSGAQNLLGQGDLLLQAGSYEPIRLQSPYLTEAERREIFTNYSRTASANFSFS